MTDLTTEIDGNLVTREPAVGGELYVVPAGCRYSSCAAGKTVEYAVLRLNEDDFSIYDLKPVHGVRDDFCYHLAQALIDCHESDRELDVKLRHSLALSTALHCLKSFGPHIEYLTTAGRQTLTTEQLQRIYDFVYQNLDRNIMLVELADLTGLTVNGLLIAFQQSTGTTPAQYIISQRLRRVQWLLSNSAQSITDIAYLTGFSNPSHLSTTFKKHLGCTPRKFRQQWRS